MQCCWLPAWLIAPESIDWTTLAVHWADETLLMPGVVICVDNSITFKCFDNFPCGKLVLHRTLSEELFRVLEKCFVFCFLRFTESVLNWFYISYQHAVTSWFADIKQALDASKIMEFGWVQNESSSTFLLSPLLWVFGIIFLTLRSSKVGWDRKVLIMFYFCCVWEDYKNTSDRSIVYYCWL